MFGFLGVIFGALGSQVGTAAAAGPVNAELREDGSYELREDGSYELRE